MPRCDSWSHWKSQNPTRFVNIRCGFGIVIDKSFVAKYSSDLHCKEFSLFFAGRVSQSVLPGTDSLVSI